MTDLAHLTHQITVLLSGMDFACIVLSLKTMKVTPEASSD